jgi:hypothetical protein
MSKARLITFDIETYCTRNPRAIEAITAEALAKRPAQNTAKELKLEWDTEAAREKRVDEALGKTACDPALAEPICVCVAVGQGKPVPFPIEDVADLASVRDHLEEMAGPQTVWCGHNIEGFDLPVLLSAWRRAGITPPRHFPQPGRSGRWFGWVYDTMQRFPSKTPFVSLDDACLALGIEGKAMTWQGEPFDGSRVGKAFEEGEIDLIVDYCLADVEIERALYMAMTAGDTWGTYGLDDDVAGRIEELRAEPMSEGTRAIAILNVLEQAGIVPRGQVAAA